MCIVDKIVCFRKLINRVIVANGGDEFNQIVALRFALVLENLLLRNPCNIPIYIQIDKCILRMESLEMI